MPELRKCGCSARDDRLIAIIHKYLQDGDIWHSGREFSYLALRLTRSGVSTILQPRADDLMESLAARGDEVALSDIRHVVWGETIKLALARGVASSIVLTTLGLLFGFFRGSSLGGILSFFLFWPFVSCIGAPIYAYMLKAISAVLSPIAGTIVTLSCDILTYLVAAMVACGDPLVFTLIRSAPHILDVSDFKPVNFKILIFVLDKTDTEGELSDIDSGSANPTDGTHETSLAPGNSIYEPTEVVSESHIHRSNVALAFSEPSSFTHETIELTPAAGGTAEDTVDNDDDPVRDLLELCDQSPREGLDWISNLSEDLLQKPVILFAKFTAEFRLAFETFTKSGRSNTSNMTRDEIKDCFDGDQTEYALEALSTIANIETLDPNYISRLGPDEDKFAETMVDNLSTAIEILQPGIVYKSLGWIKLKYFGSSRIGLIPGLADSDASALIKFCVNIKIRHTPIFRSVIVLSISSDSSGRFISCEILEKCYEETDTIGDAGMLGFLRLYENGSALFESAEDQRTDDPSYQLDDGLSHPKREHLLEEAEMLLRYEDNPERIKYLKQMVEWLNGRAPKPLMPSTESNAAISGSRPGGLKAWQWGIGALFGVWLLSSLHSCVTGPSRSPTVPAVVPQPVEASPPGDTTPSPVQPSYNATSFDCARAVAWAETQICATRSLADSDQRQAALYSEKMRLATGPDQVSLRADQRAWLSERTRCASQACLESSFATRIVQLENWEPKQGGHQSEASTNGALPVQPQPVRGSGSNAGSRASPSKRQRESQAGKLEICILPTGQEVRTVRAECRQRGGVIY